ncbi:hypothetical protein FHW16_001379 [Phyllobacterium myrsinacearum]|uniref:Uncharacterized protein n=1 Tax=Phyllobacterium myrsinacearum TaxID=28101 RepID=A0A839EMJ0_9HYPH|nr:hypothetical protein [Phyllobacterium myrsinacearum]
MAIPMMENDISHWHYQSAWFDKLTMRTFGGCLTVAQVMNAHFPQSIQLPHGELVEPRTLVMQGTDRYLSLASQNLWRGKR